MNFFLQHSPLRDLYEKVVAGQRISDEDALHLFESKDLNAVGAIADFVRQRKAGYNTPKRVFFAEALPKNAVGKILKHVLRDTYRGAA